MRFGNWRGVTPALGCLLAVCVSTSPAKADGFHTIPSLTPAIDLNTGQQYYAPPIPYGHYAGKDLTGKVGGHARGLLGHFGGLGHGSGCGKGGCGGANCGDPGCGGSGGGHGHGGLFGKHKGTGMGDGCGICGGSGASCFGHTSTVAPSPQGYVTPAPQGYPVSDECGDPGCGLFGKHHKRGHGLCSGGGNPCGACGGKGCGLCGKGLGGGLCRGCGGAGCGLCGKAKGLAHGLVSKALGHDKIKWFNGPGGPVPLTPGYVPYVNVVRSPREFFSFPPMNP